MELDKVDINLLYHFHQNNAMSPFHSQKITEILASEFEPKMAYYSMQRRLTKLVKLEYMSEGFKEQRSKTYYLNENGIDFLNENVFTDEDNYKEYEEENNNQNNNEENEEE